MKKYLSILAALLFVLVLAIAPFEQSNTMVLAAATSKTLEPTIRWLTLALQRPQFTRNI